MKTYAVATYNLKDPPAADDEVLVVKREDLDAFAMQVGAYLRLYHARTSQGATVSPPFAMHTYECPQWKKAYEPCVCGAAALTAQLDNAELQLRARLQEFVNDLASLYTGH